MALESVDHGSQTATIDEEHTLAAETDAGIYVLAVDTTNLVAGDIVILRIKVKAVHDGSSLLAYAVTYSGAQVEVVKFSVPVPIDTEIVCTLEQTDGTGRAFPWNLLKA